MMKKMHVLCGLVLAGLTLSGCQDTKKAFGFSKSIPDENTVMERAPLTVPDNLELRPPRTGDAEGQYEATEKAKKAILGDTKKSKDKSALEKDILQKAKVDHADPNIRKQMADEPLKEGKTDILDATKESQKQTADKKVKDDKEQPKEPNEEYPIDSE